MPRGYTGYLDQDQGGYSGTKANIQHIAPTQVGVAVATWIGLNEATNAAWVQIGWHYRFEGPGYNIGRYAEVQRRPNGGSYNIYFFDHIPNNGHYTVEQAPVLDVVNARWIVDGQVLHQEPWAGIAGDGAQGLSALDVHQVQVECLDYDVDYVPGSELNPCHFTNIEVRPYGLAYQPPPLAVAVNTNPHGVEAKNQGGGAMWVQVYDNRNAAFDASTPSRASRSRPSVPSLLWSGPDSPLAWREQVGRGLLSIDHIASCARRDVGAGDDLDPITAIRRVYLHDAHPFGARAGEAGYLVSLSRVPVYTPDLGVRCVVDLEAFYDSQGHLLVAASAAQERWLARCSALPRMDPEAEARRVHVLSSHQPDTNFQMTLAEVLGVAWQSTSIAPHHAGQIVLRPRRVAPHFPLVERAGQWLPKQAEGPHWIVQVCGALVHQISDPDGGASGYLSGLLAFVSDGQREMFYGIGLA